MIVLLNVYICALRKMSANSETDRTPTKRNNNGAVARVRVSVELRKL